jgi:hypothetical protein
MSPKKPDPLPKIRIQLDELDLRLITGGTGKPAPKTPASKKSEPKNLKGTTGPG